ncbi:Hypothetical_protein [Hexamita inflata]|uniref:Hypothetical_protein n=1 Tax=Hexamita inflata TaxID=28002 RepID=A0AA86UAA2_9EUKA|nr:Hypothetical protein HINF_LOCUS32506 [Hexamita inflata]
MKKSKFPIVNEFSKFATNMILQDSYNTQNYINSDVSFEKSKRMEFSFSNDWSFDLKLTQLNRYKQKPQLQPENMEQFVRTFSSESSKMQKVNNSPARKRLRRSYINNDIEFENDISFEVIGVSKELVCNLSNVSGVINLSKEFD